MLWLPFQMPFKNGKLRNCTTFENQTSPVFESPLSNKTIPEHHQGWLQQQLWQHFLPTSFPFPAQVNRRRRKRLSSNVELSNCCSMNDELFQPRAFPRVRVVVVVVGRTVKLAQLAQSGIRALPEMKIQLNDAKAVNKNDN